MGSFGRAPAPPTSEAGKGRQTQGARHVYRDRRDRHRYRQEHVLRRGPRCARRDPMLPLFGTAFPFNKGVRTYSLTMNAADSRAFPVSAFPHRKDAQNSAARFYSLPRSRHFSEFTINDSRRISSANAESDIVLPFVDRVPGFSSRDLSFSKSYRLTNWQV